MKDNKLSLTRFWCIFIKEFLQLKRDKLAFVMLIIIPMMQMIMLGFAINHNPKKMPTAIHIFDYTDITRTFLNAMHNSDYFKVTHILAHANEVEALFAENKILFSVTIPANFTRDLLRGEMPNILIEADGTDLQAISVATNSLHHLIQSVVRIDLKGSLAHLNQHKPPFNIILHQRYNPEAISKYTLIPSLMGVILTMTLVIMTSIALTREYEIGTMENMLAMPFLPIEIMLGKVLPFVLIGLVQFTVILCSAIFIFEIPFLGGLLMLYTVALVFIATNLMVGIFISCIARNQLQASQLSTVYFLPSIMLSGSLFPYNGMPEWAQWLAECLPLTHFNRLLRTVMLKGGAWSFLWVDIWPMLLFTIIILIFARLCYRSTLD